MAIIVPDPAETDEVGHISDHNLIVQALLDLDAAIAAAPFPVVSATPPPNPTVGQIWIIPVVPPVAGFSASPLSGSISFTVTVVDSSTGATTVEYDWGDGTGITSGPTHVYTSAGTWTITQTVNNAAGSDTATVNITANAPASGYNSYVDFNGADNNCFSSPSVANDVFANGFELVARVRPYNVLDTFKNLISLDDKTTESQRRWSFDIFAGAVGQPKSTVYHRKLGDATGFIGTNFTTWPAVSNNTDIWIKVVGDWTGTTRSMYINTGGAATEPSSWTLINTVTQGTTPGETASSTLPITVGAAGNYSSKFNGRVYFVRMVASGGGHTITFNPNNAVSNGATTWTEPGGRVWTRQGGTVVKI